jgi:hypothetical protein
MDELGDSEAVREELPVIDGEIDEEKVTDGEKVVEAVIVGEADDEDETVGEKEADGVLEGVVKA